MKRKISFRKFFNIIMIINLIVILSVFIFNNIISELELHYNTSFWIVLTINILLIIILNKFKDKKYVEDIFIVLIIIYLVIAFWIPVCSEGNFEENVTDTGVKIPSGYTKSFNCYNFCIRESYIK